MLKNKIRYWCQQLIGLDRYLFLFARLTIFRIRYLGYEKEFRFFMDLVPDQGNILDIGANIGVMSVVLAKRFPQSMVHAFEPVPRNAATLHRVKNFFGLENILIYQTALGNTTGLATMHTPMVNTAVMHGLSHVWQKIEETVPADIYQVPLTTLDTVQSLQQCGIISAIKIDVENFEYYVLQGGRQLIEHHKPVVYAELWNDEKKSHCISLMQELGYAVQIYCKGSLADYQGEDVLNYFFLPGKKELYI
jgi:FkbM family methyltransferase